MTLFLIVIRSGNGYQRFYPHIEKLLFRCPYRWRADCRQELILCVFECRGSRANLSNDNVQTYITRRYRRFLKEEYEWQASKGTELGAILAEFDGYFEISGIENLSELASKAGYQVIWKGDNIILRSSLDIGSFEQIENDCQRM